MNEFATSSCQENVVNRVILERMKDRVDLQLKEQQAGFRKNQSWCEQITTLHIIIQQSRIDIM